MARVLIVEDEDRYRDIVVRYLGLRGHDAVDTASGEEAIALGLMQRPDVLVADWMLRHSIHGLHVAEALRTADPSLHTVLVTGFPDRDLTMDRVKVGIVALLEKPFDVEDLGEAVERAAKQPPSRDSEIVGVVVVDGAGQVRHRNHAARAFLPVDTDARPTLAPDAFLRLREAGERWVRIAGPSNRCWARARELPDGHRLVVLCSLAQEWRRDDPRVRMLLGQPLSRRTHMGLQDPVLLVDDSATVCDTFVAQLASRGCVAHAAPSHARALDTFRAEPDIGVVILDWAMPGEDLRTTVAQLREIRPSVRLIGTSGEDRRTEFAELGIDSFLRKPWTVAGDLATLLGGGASQTAAYES